jgi:hypothetical protein
VSNGKTFLDVAIDLYNWIGNSTVVIGVIASVVVHQYASNKKRNAFIQELMKMAPIDKDEFVSTIKSIEKLFDAKFNGLDKRFDDLIKMIDALNKK